MLLENVEFSQNTLNVHLANNTRNIPLVNLLLENGADPTDDRYRPFLIAAEKDNQEVLNLFLTYPGLEINAHDLLTAAYSYGSTTIIKNLLKNTHIDDKDAIIPAILHGDRGIIQFLLYEMKVDPSAQNNFSLLYAIEERKIPLLKDLLNHPHIDPNYPRDEPILVAIRKGDSRAVKLLLNHPRINLESPDILLEAIKARKSTKTQRKEEIRPTKENRDRLESIELIMNHPDVDPSARNNQALRLAVERGDAEVIRLLLTDDRVRETYASNPIGKGLLKEFY